MKWRKSLYDIIEVADEQNTLSKLYDWMMMIVIVVSIIPLAVRNVNYDVIVGIWNCNCGIAGRHCYSRVYGRD